MKGNNPQRTHYVTDYQFPYKYVRTITDGNHLKNTSSGPIIENNIMYDLSTEDSTFVAYDMTNGTVLWRRILSGTGSLSGHPGNATVVHNPNNPADVRLVVPAGEEIYVLDEKTGTPLKQFITRVKGQVNRFADGPLCLSNGDCYIGSWNHHIYGFNVLDSSSTPFMDYNAGGVISGSGTLAQNGSTIVFGVDRYPGKILTFNVASRSFKSSKTTDVGVSGDCTTPDGTTVYCVDKTTKLYTWNLSSGAFNKYDGASALQGSNWKMIFAPAYDPVSKSLYITVNKRNTGEGYLFKYNPSNGSYKQLHYESAGIAGSPVAIANGAVMYATGKGNIKAVNGSNGADFSWYRDSSGKQYSFYQMSGVRSYSELALGGGNKKVLVVNGAGGIYQFEPDYANIHAMSITALDSSGNSKTTFTDTEPITIRGTFRNDGTRAVNNVEHIATMNGTNQSVITKNYSVNQTNNVDQVYSSLAPGTYTFVFKADPSNKIQESDETDNNTGSITITVTATKPDLAGQSASTYDRNVVAKTTFNYGEPVTVKGVFKNIGTRNASGVNHTFTLNGTQQGNAGVVDYSVGQSKTISQTFSNLPAGNYTVYGTADYTNSIAESSETNNNTPTASFTVSAVPPPTTINIAAQSIKAYDSTGTTEQYQFNAGATIQIKTTYQNTGSSIVNSVEHTIYVNGVQQTITTANYTAGGSNTLTFSLSGLSPGIYQIYGLGDPNNKVTESDETDNQTNTITVLIKAPTSPFIIADSMKSYKTSDTTKTSTSTFGPNDNISVDGNFENIGNASASNVEHATYVDGVEVGSRILKNYGLAPSNTNTVTASLGKLARGTHTIKMVADPENKILMNNPNNTFIQAASTANPNPYDNYLTFDQTAATSYQLSNIATDTTTANAKTTVEFWMNWDGTEFEMPLGFSGYDLFMASGYFGFNTGRSDFYGNTYANMGITPNKWIHVSAVFNNGNIDLGKIYINGVQKTLVDKFFDPTNYSTHATVNVANKLTVSGFNDVSGKYNLSGKLAAVKVWNYERTQSQIQSDMNVKVTGNEAGLVTHLDSPSDSLDLTNTSQEVALSNIPVNTAAGAVNTVEFWVNWDGTNGSLPISFSSNYTIWITSNGIGFNTLNGDMMGAPIGSNIIGKWTHVTASFYNGVISPTSVVLYINGVKQTLSAIGQPTPTTPYSVSPNLHLAGNVSGLKFTGQLADVRVWKGARTAAQVTSDMTGSLTGNEAGLAGYWTPDDYTTSKVYDHSTAKNDGAPVGFTPIQFVSQATPNGIQLEWENAGDNTTYELQRDGVDIYSGQDLSYVDTNVTPNTQYTYQLIARTPNGESTNSLVNQTYSKEIDTTITVQGTPPTAKFSSVSSALQNSNITFTNQTTEPDGDQVSYSWLIKIATDPDTSYSEFSDVVNPNNFFDTPGTYTVKLVASDIDGQSEYTQNITITPSTVVPGFTDDSPYYIGDTCTLTSTAYDTNGLSLTYDYLIVKPDGSSFHSTNTNPSFTCDQAGDYNVTQTVQNTLGNTATYQGVITAIPRTLTPGFIDDSPYIVGDMVNITSTAFGAPGATLSYLYTIVCPDGSSFTSTAVNPAFIGSQVGTYTVTQAVTDNFGNQATYTDYVIVDNLPPVAGFTTDKASYFNDQKVYVTSTAYDQNGDPLTYQYTVTAPDGSTATYSDVNPSFNSLQIGTYTIDQVVTDPYGATDEYVNTITVVNRPPNAAFVTDKPSYTVNDTISVTSAATDPDNQPLTYVYQITDPNGVVTTQNVANFTIPANVIGNWTITQTVTDPYGASSSISSTIPVTDLSIIGHVDHTPDWTAKHQALGHNPQDFYSGETFVLHADVSSYPKDYVKATLTAPLVDGTTYTETVLLNKDSETQYSLDYYRDSFSQPATYLKNGPAQFTFEVRYSNGEIRTDVVNVNIIGNVYDALNLHRTY
ncbi:hypothetical protein HPT25_26310 [Bacillus sp. BRMEA1]|nr:hypothetical protein [Neobacillus endophyticus]